MRILVTDGMDKGAIEKVRAMGHELVEQFYEPDELGKALRDFDVAIIRSKTKLRAKQIEGQPLQVRHPRRCRPRQHRRAVRQGQRHRGEEHPEVPLRVRC